MPTIFNLRYVNRGVSGTTVIPQAVRARIEHGASVKESRGGGSEIPDDVVTVGLSPRVFVETEEVAQFTGWLVSAGALQTEQLVVGYRAGNANRKLTFKSVKLANVSEIAVDPIEGGGRATRYQLEFVAVKATGADTMATYMTDGTDT